MSVSVLTTLLTSVILLLEPGSISPGGDPFTTMVAGFAGDYYYGDGLGVNCSFTVMPNGRFAFRWTGCLGVYDQNTGAATVVAGHLILMPERPNVRKGFRGTATDFQVIRWGERLYLIPEQDKAAFCEAVNQRREPRSISHGGLLPPSR